MENKIGEIVTLPPYDIKARVVEIKGNSCKGCYYCSGILCLDYQDNGMIGYCDYIRRKDHKGIIYKPLIEKLKSIEL